MASYGEDEQDTRGDNPDYLYGGGSATNLTTLQDQVNLQLLQNICVFGPIIANFHFDGIFQLLLLFRLFLLQEYWSSAPAMMTPGSATTLPLNKRRPCDKSATPSFEEPGPSPLVPPAALPYIFPLRRSTSVEVLLEEEPPAEQATPQQSDPPSSHRFSLTKSLSISSATPTTPLTFSPIFRNHRGAVFTDSMATPSPRANDEGLSLSVVHEESRLTARRGSASSVVIISHTHTHIEGVDGFDVIGRPLDPNFSHLDDTESVSSGEFEYMPNPYSKHHRSGGGRGTGSATPTPPMIRGSATPPPAMIRGSATPPPRWNGRRRSPVSEVLLPAATVAMHVVAAGFILLTQQ